MSVMGHQGEILIRTAGLNRSERGRVSRDFASGKLVKLRAGIYVPSREFHQLKPWERYRVRCLAVAVSRPAYVLVGKSAAAIWRMPYGEVPDQVEVARVDGMGDRGGAVRGILFRSLIRIEGQQLYGLARPNEVGQLTSIAHTLVDLARWHGVVDAVVAMDDCLRRQRIDRAELSATIDAAPSCRGIAAARRALELAHAASESPRESEVRMRIWQAGLPAPHLQAVIRDYHGNFIGRVDLFYPEFSVAIEYDGEAKYLGAFRIPPLEAMKDERRREKELINAGVDLVRVDLENFRTGSWLVDLRRKIDAARSRRGEFPAAQWTSAGPAWVGRGRLPK